MALDAIVDARPGSIHVDLIAAHLAFVPLLAHCPIANRSGGGQRTVTSVKSGVTHFDEVLSLLNDAYGGWGGEDLFRWKYLEYPGFAPDESCFYVREDEIVAFRRLFEKQLRRDGRSVTTYVFGDGAVAPEYQGEGYYSDLRDVTTAYCENRGAHAMFSYNKVGHITYKANRNSGWESHLLPLYLYIHSYPAVLKRYAESAVSGDTPLTTAMKTIGSHMTIRTPSGAVSVSELFDGDGRDASIHIPIAADHDALTELVETANNTPASRWILRGGELTLAGKLVPFGEPGSRPRPTIDDHIGITSGTAVGDETVESMVSLFECVRSGDLSFRRTRRDVEHMLAYPDARVLLYKSAGEVVGFAVLGAYENGSVVEARVLDLVAPSPRIFTRLVQAIERYTLDQGFDLVVLLSECDPGRHWTSIDKQVVMWDTLDDDELAATFPPVISMFDVL